MRSSICEDVIGGRTCMDFHMDLLMCIPFAVDVTATQMMEQLRKLLDICESTHQFNMEWWTVRAGGTEPITDWEFPITDRPRWGQLLAKWPKGFHHASAMVHGLIGERLDDSLGLYCGIRNAKGVEPYQRTLADVELYKTEECFLRMAIPARVWDAMDRPLFISTFQQACCALRACYAAVDERGVPSRLSKSLYRQFFQDAESIPMESRLPGIFWAQFITAGMVEKTGTLAEIAAKAPFGIVQEINQNGVEGLWMQLTPDIHKAPPAKRLPFRRFFAESLYELSMPRIAASKYAPRMTNRLPLEQWERQEVRRLREETKQRVDRR